MHETTEPPLSAPLPAATAPRPALDLAVVIPTRQLDAELAAGTHALVAGLQPSEVIIVEPEDAAPAGAVALPAGCRLLRAPRGRGTQCNAGAQASRARLLLFLHDDTRLPADAAQAIAEAFADPTVGMACFRLRFDRHHPLLALYAWCSRFDSVWTTFGDQGYLIRRSLFDAVGGFPDWPLFEDVELARRVRRQSGTLRRIRKLGSEVTTSAVRFERSGVLRQQLRNALAMLRFFAGASPQRLAAAYERRR
jgi:rSAM/selenodomain-associated transferase 2